MPRTEMRKASQHCSRCLHKVELNLYAVGWHCLLQEGSVSFSPNIL
jgi:hypothetical protein